MDFYKILYGITLIEVRCRIRLWILSERISCLLELLGLERVLIRGFSLHC